MDEEVEDDDLNDWENYEEDRAEGECSGSEEDDGFNPMDVKRSRTTSDAPELPSFVFPPLPPSIPVVRNAEDAVLNNQWEALLSTAQTMALPRRQTALPWERGFASLVFGTTSILTAPVRLPPIPPPVPSGGSSSSSIPQANPILLKAVDTPGAWPVIARRMKGLNWDDSRELKRSKALQRLKEFFHQNPEGTGLGRLLMKDILSMESESNLTSAISDIFSRKATKTLAKRSWALTRYALFCRLRRECPVPIVENTLYAYLVSECATSSSKGRQICEALNFTISTLQVDGAFEATSSPRVKGFCFKQGLTKRPLKQAVVLSVGMVTALESMVHAEREFVPDRIFSGHAAACVHGRIRWSDSQRLVHAKLDVGARWEGFLDTKSLLSKTATTESKRTQFLPTTILLGGISSDSWAQEWLRLREDANLEFSEHTPVMPGVNLDGSFSEDELDAGSASKWLREILIRSGFSQAQVVGVSSHSLKATALSWAAKYGLAKTTRQVLGYHVVDGGSALHYSRDEQAGPLRRLQKCYADIRSGHFRPDETRSGYILRVRKRNEWPELVPLQSLMKPTAKVRVVKPRSEEIEEGFDYVFEEEEPVLDVDDEEVPLYEASSSTSDSSSESDDDIVDEELADIEAFDTPLALLPRSAVRAAGDRLFVHKLWSTVHKAHAVQQERLACGRPIHAGFAILPEGCNLVRPRCTVCFGRGPQVE